MHFLYFVAVPKETGTNIDEVQAGVRSLLDENNFAGQDGSYWGNGKCDWYEIGGRWADFFAKRLPWVQKAEAEIEEYLNRPENLRTYDDGKKTEKYNIKGTSYGDEQAIKKQSELRERCELIFSKHRPKDYPRVPWDRYHSDKGIFGNVSNKTADSTVVLDEDVAKYILEHNTTRNLGGEPFQIFVANEEENETDEWFVKDFLTNSEILSNSETREIDKSILGKYWITIVDYHM